MSDGPAEPKPLHRRRPRYRGTHPRRFDEKYKELAADRYPDLIVHVRAQGKTPAGQHRPILVDEVLAALAPTAGDHGVDATLGWGGHAEQILPRLAPGGTLLGLDQDPIELPRTEARLRNLGHAPEALLVRRTNFAGLRAAIDDVGWSEGADFVFADLGVSSMQIDDPSRGFSFKHDGPLDMRMNPKRGLPAAEWLARVSVDELAAALRTHADEPEANAIAEAIHARQGSLTTTRALASAVRDALDRRVTDEDADAAVRRVFQAVRIEINDELGALDALLRTAPASLRAGGRIAVLTFHSGEDRRVKKAFEQGQRDGVYSEIATELVRVSQAERRANPRASSAKLRWARV